MTITEISRSTFPGAEKLLREHHIHLYVADKKEATETGMAFAGIISNKLILVMDMLEGFAKDEIECIICHEIGHYVLKTEDEKAADKFALCYVSREVYLSTIAKTWMYAAEHRRKQGLPVKKFGKKYSHRNPLMKAYCAAHGINWNPGE